VPEKRQHVPLFDEGENNPPQPLPGRAAKKGRISPYAIHKQISFSGMPRTPREKVGNISCCAVPNAINGPGDWRGSDPARRDPHPTPRLG
jgi:hypothetical protein